MGGYTNNRRALLRAGLSAGLFLAVGACSSGSILEGAPGSEDSVLEDYRLGPGDVIRIAVFGEERLSGQFQIGPTGSISYPLVGEVPVQGQTVAEFVASLTETLRNGYVRQADVTVEVATYRPFYMLGEIGGPGTYPYTPGLTVLNAIATAGGFTYRATNRRVFIRHADAAGEREYELTSTTPVRPGDTIRVPERRF